VRAWVWGILLLTCLRAMAWSATREYEIKAGFIYNFFRFVEWPKPGDPWQVGIMGSDPFEGALRDFESRPISGKAIQVRKVNELTDAKKCDVVFIGPSESTRISATLTGLKGSSVLTISDIPSFADKGGAIGLTTESNRVRFIINIDTLKQSNLKASARFLQLATRTISHSEHPDEVLQAVSFHREGDDELLQKLFGF